MPHYDDDPQGIESAYSGTYFPTPEKNRAKPTFRNRIFGPFERYWFVWIPAVLLNTVMAIDHVVAKHNEKEFSVTLNTELLSSVRAQDSDRLSETLQAHWITANKDGNLDGRISAIDPNQSTSIPIEQLDVTLIRKGEEIRTAVTDGDGRFVLEKVDPGVYTLVASGVNGFLAYGVHVLPKLEDFKVLELDAQVNPAQAKRAYYVSYHGLPKNAVVQESLQIDAAAVPPEFTTLQRISQNYLPAAAALAIGRDTNDLKALGKATEIKGGFQFPLEEDGSFGGRIQPIATEDGEPAKLSDMNMFLIQDDLEVARVAVEENGQFKIEDVKPGVYSLVAAGKEGFAALSLDLVKSEKATEEAQGVGALPGETKAHYVSYQDKKLPSFYMAIVTDPKDIDFLKKKIDQIAAQRLTKLEQQTANRVVEDSSFVQPNGYFGSPPGVGSPAYGAGQAPMFQSPAAPPSSGNGRPIAKAIALALLGWGISELANGSSVVDPTPQSPFIVQIQ